MHLPSLFSPRHAAACAFLAALSPLATAQNAGQWTEFRTHVDQSGRNGFGDRCLSIGDINADGSADYLVAASAHRDANQIEIGKVYLYSGTDGSLIREYLGSNNGSRMGFDMAAMGDINSDGVPDYVIAEPDGFMSAGLNFGWVHMYSGADGSVIHTWTGSETDTKFGEQVENVGDWDGDGVNDLAIGEPFFNSDALRCGRVQVFSGVTGLELISIQGPEEHSNFGVRIYGPGDINNDGSVDLMVQRRLTGTDILKSMVDVYSGRTEKRIATLRSPRHHAYPSNSFGHGMIALDDWNGDGFQEIAISDFTAGLGGLESRGLIWIYDGRTGLVVKTIAGHAEQRWLGHPLVGLGDVDGDGFRDFAAGQLGHENHLIANGAVAFFSGGTGQLMDRLQGQIHHGRFGFCIGDATDLNGDGRAEVLIGVPGMGTVNSAPSELQIWSWSP